MKKSCFFPEKKFVTSEMPRYFFQICLECHGQEKDRMLFGACRNQPWSEVTNTEIISLPIC